MKLGIYIFCRDLRIQDNLGLYNFKNFLDDNFDNSLGPSKILPIFILNPAQVTCTTKNKYYFSNSAVQFMCESLQDLSKQLYGNLHIFYGDPIVICNYLFHKFGNLSSVGLNLSSGGLNLSSVGLNLSSVGLNLSSGGLNLCAVGFQKDFSDFAIKRQKSVEKLCAKFKIKLYVEENDFSLLPIRELCKKNGEGFKQFGAFYKQMQKNKNLDSYQLVSVKKDVFLKKNNSLKYLWNIYKLRKLYKENKLLSQRGGRTQALNKLRGITKKNLGDYREKRNYLSYSTSGISAYLNFGCISIREAYKKISESLGKSSELLKQIFWRDFYLQAVIYLEDGNKFDYMDKRYNDIKWKNSENDWNKIMRAETGFLLVDAAMRQMIETGFMHNRARMIVGVFWTKYCLIDTFHPKYGSQVGYSRFLVDAVGISQNKMNHQWITEFDYPGKKYAPRGIPLAGRPMDISNKNIRKFDPNCDYIKKWIPELKNMNIKTLINWNRETYDKFLIHVPPMFDDPRKKYQEWIEACNIK
jgi:deoxyribodipyrimidine photo-lyase